MNTYGADSDPHSNPRRDRALAAQPRHGFRNAIGMNDLSKQFLSSQAMRNAKRFQRIYGILRDLLGPEIATEVKPHHLRGGKLTLLVSDSVLLAELRNHFHHQLIEACVARGAG